jgi:Uma2 family endonuclease
MNTITTAVEAKLITGEELLAMGDIGPCELIDGRIVPMSPTNREHGFLEVRLSRALGNFVEPRQLGEVLSGEVGIYTRRNPDRIRGADIVFRSKARAATEPSEGFLMVAPELVIEIISPTDRWSDIRKKIEEYFAIGVLWIWVLEPSERDVLLYRSATEFQKLREGDILRGEGILEGFALSVADLFADF